VRGPRNIRVSKFTKRDLTGRPQRLDLPGMNAKNLLQKLFKVEFLLPLMLVSMVGLTALRSQNTGAAHYDLTPWDRAIWVNSQIGHCTSCNCLREGIEFARLGTEDGETHFMSIGNGNIERKPPNCGRKPPRCGCPRPRPGYGYCPPKPSPGYGYNPPIPSPGYGYNPPIPSPGYGYNPPEPSPGYGYNPPLPSPGYGYNPPEPTPPGDGTPLPTPTGGYDFSHRYIMNENGFYMPLQKTQLLESLKTQIQEVNSELNCSLEEPTNEMFRYLEKSLY
jgi:hypothetical protein